MQHNNNANRTCHYRIFTVYVQQQKSLLHFSERAIAQEKELQKTWKRKHSVNYIPT
jgi:hypothetical protein